MTKMVEELLSMDEQSNPDLLKAYRDQAKRLMREMRQSPHMFDLEQPTVPHSDPV